MTALNGHLNGALDLIPSYPLMAPVESQQALKHPYTTDRDYTILQID